MQIELFNMRNHREDLGSREVLIYSGFYFHGNLDEKLDSDILGVDLAQADLRLLDDGVYRCKVDGLEEEVDLHIWTRMWPPQFEWEKKVPEKRGYAICLDDARAMADINKELKEWGLPLRELPTK